MNSPFILQYCNKSTKSARFEQAATMVGWSAVGKYRCVNCLRGQTFDNLAAYVPPRLAAHCRFMASAMASSAS